uniref:Uncharacterized protein n=1 Tax=Arundo donax TaxID=35708 RepID=A0A0A9B4C1_ARUDO
MCKVKVWSTTDIHPHYSSISQLIRL